MPHTTPRFLLATLLVALAAAPALAAPGDTLGHPTELLVAVDQRGSAIPGDLGTVSAVAGEPLTLRVRVHDPASGRGVGGVPVQATRFGTAEPLATGSTGPDGNAALTVTANEGGELEVTATPGGRTHRVRVRVNVASPLRTWLTTDKPLYLPGQTAVIRTLTVRMPSRAAAEGVPVTVTVKNPFGIAVGRSSGRADAFGIYPYSFAIAAEGAEGTHEIEAVVEGGERLSARIVVERYRLPKFVLSVATDASGYAPGEAVAARLNAAYTFGEPVAGGAYTFFARVQWDGGLREIHSRSGALNELGRARESFRIPDDIAAVVQTGEASLFCQMDVTDAAGNRGTAAASAFVAIHPVSCAVRAEAGAVLRPKTRNWCLARFTTADGTPVHAALAAQVGSEMLTGETAPNGIWRFPVDVGSSHPGDLRAVITDAGGAQRVLRAPLPPLGEERPFTISLDHAIAEPGAPVPVRVAWANAADSKQPLVFEWRHRGQVIASSAGVAESGLVSLTAPSRVGVDGFVELRAYRSDLGVRTPDGGERETALMLDRAWQTPIDAASVSAALFIPSPRILKIDAAWLDSYKPGDPATLAVKVTRADGNAPGQTALSVELIDLGVLTLRPRDRVALTRYLMFEPSLASEPMIAEAPVAGSTAKGRARAEAAVRWIGSLQLAGLDSVPFARSLTSERAVSAARVEALAGEIRKARPFVAFRRIYREPIAWLQEHGGLDADAFRDAWGRPLEFDADNVCVRSLGPDGTAGTADDLVAAVER